MTTLEDKISSNETSTTMGTTSRALSVDPTTVSNVSSGGNATVPPSSIVETSDSLAREQEEKQVASSNNSTISPNNEKKSEAIYNSSNQTTAAVGADHYQGLPQWIEDYFVWHRSMVRLYPGEDILTNPDAPNIILRSCLGTCGGLHDRLGQLPWDLYLANQTRRVYFIRWDRPRPLETFLTPNLINWTFPMEDIGPDMMKKIRNLTAFFGGPVPDFRPEPSFWMEMDRYIARATTGTYRDVKILRHRILGHLNESDLEDRLLALGETDTLHWTPSFGRIFQALFRPSDGVQREIKKVSDELNLVPGEYSAVHCRVRHPKAAPRGSDVLKGNPRPADRIGLPWYGSSKEYAIDTAVDAVKCAQGLTNDSPNQPIYFLSDSNDLVQYMAHDIKSANLTANASYFNHTYDRVAFEATQSVNLVARESSSENAHIDRQKGRSIKEYYATFIDFYLTMNARCVVFGIGFYAAFATKISSTSCKRMYQEESWGKIRVSKRTQLCSQQPYKHEIHADPQNA